MGETSRDPPEERQNKGTAFMVVTLTFTVIASVVVNLRVYIRIWVKRTFGWDDGLIIFSLVKATSCNSHCVIRLTYASSLPSFQRPLTYLK